jgi:hypothetical protein
LQVRDLVEWSLDFEENGQTGIITALKFRGTMALHSVFVSVVLIAAAALHTSCAKETAASADPTRQLKRSAGKRWDSVREVIRAEIKSATKHFLEERSRVSAVAVASDLLFLYRCLRDKDTWVPKAGPQILINW